MRQIWKNNVEHQAARGRAIYDRAIDVQIMRLRRKIENDPAQPRYIRTERGEGYVFSVPVKTVY